MCPTVLDNKTYLSRKWILNDKNVFIVCDVEGRLNEWIKLFKITLGGHQTLFIKIPMNSKWILYTVSSSRSKNSVLPQAVTPTNIAL